MAYVAGTTDLARLLDHNLGWQDRRLITLKHTQHTTSVLLTFSRHLLQYPLISCSVRTILPCSQHFTSPINDYMIRIVNRLFTILSVSKWRRVVTYCIPSLCISSFPKHISPRKQIKLDPCTIYPQLSRNRQCEDRLELTSELLISMRD